MTKPEGLRAFGSLVACIGAAIVIKEFWWAYVNLRLDGSIARLMLGRYPLLALVAIWAAVRQRPLVLAAAFGAGLIPEGFQDPLGVLAWIRRSGTTYYLVGAALMGLGSLWDRHSTALGELLRPIERRSGAHIVGLGVLISGVALFQSGPNHDSLDLDWHVSLGPVLPFLEIRDLLPFALHPLSGRLPEVAFLGSGAWFSNLAAGLLFAWALYQLGRLERAFFPVIGWCFLISSISLAADLVWILPPFLLLFMFAAHGPVVRIGFWLGLVLVLSAQERTHRRAASTAEGE